MGAFGPGAMDNDTAWDYRGTHFTDASNQIIKLLKETEDVYTLRYAAHAFFALESADLFSPYEDEGEAMPTYDVLKLATERIKSLWEGTREALQELDKDDFRYEDTKEFFLSVQDQLESLENMLGVWDADRAERAARKLLEG